MLTEFFDISPTMDLSNVSRHMGTKLQILLPKLACSHSTPVDGIHSIDLSIAENALIGEAVLVMAKEAVAKSLTLKDLSYPAGVGGDSGLLKALAGFFNTYFKPSTSVKPEHVIATSGAGNALDALLSSICDEGDQVLVLGPCWEGFTPYLLIHANVEPIIVNAPTLEGSTQMDIVYALRDVYNTATHPERIKGVVLTNPSNPLGKCYTVDVLRKILEFCDVNEMHLISDEVYALSRLQNVNCFQPFISALSLLDDNLNANLATLAPRVHVVWSMSKDFGCSGIRLGCIISQANMAARIGSGLASYWQISSLASAVAVFMLNSPDVPNLIARNSELLGEAYTILTDGLTKLAIKYIPADYGLFLFAKVGEHCKTPKDEVEIVKGLKKIGLIVAPGQRFNCGGQEYGWVRITFSQPAKMIRTALIMIETYLGDYYMKREITNMQLL
ncbi:1-aminocyclopropane-1-carboxylate synthase 7 [Penicillium angulare]|uniref:1-aminocyclopropane-1-carboxylate synthase 7 n=1 Tax=Penicillium angulare TaxID=116970 RepID=A0A9W9G856_9EURO|nr:1-aminocyclopropane-1-carboxylate synthase 7 [Penicillium angulare]